MIYSSEGSGPSVTGGTGVESMSLSGPPMRYLGRHRRDRIENRDREVQEATCEEAFEALLFCHKPNWGESATRNARLRKMRRRERERNKPGIPRNRR